MSSQLGKYQIKVDATTLADGDSIASYLVAAAGLLLTSTTIGATERLDVNDIASHIDGSAYATTADYLMSAGAVDSSGNWAPLNLDATGALKVAASVTIGDNHAEDSPHTSGDIGSFSLLVRQDTLATSTSADGDYGAFKSTAAGELYVFDTATHTTLTSVDGTLTALSKAEDAAASSGDRGIQALLVRQDTLASSTSADGDYGSFKSNAKGELYTKDADTLAELVLIKGDTASIATSTATTATNTGTTASTLTALSKAEDAAHSSGDQGIQALAVRKDAQGSNVSADGDYASFQQWSEGSIKVVDIANGTILQQQVSVTNVAAQVPLVNLANRKTLMLQNTGANKLYIGSATVTSTGATTGIELPANSFMELECGPAVAVYAVKVGVSLNTLNVLEMA